MPELPDYKTSFGRYLARCRKERGISAESLAAELKISLNLLNAIENEAFDRLPDPIYTKGFLRAYALSMGADNDWVLQDYLKRLFARQARQQEEGPGGHDKDSFWRRLTGVTVVVLGVIALTLLVSVQRKNHEGIPRPDNNAVVSQAEEAPVAPKNKDDFRLSIRTVEQTWVKIIIDGKTTREYTLQPGDRLELKASTGYNLLIGNATGLRLFLNDKPVHVSGKRGEVVNLELP